VLDDLERRLRRTRWTSGPRDAGWGFGTSPSYLRELLAYWQNQFDWRRAEFTRAGAMRWIIEAAKGWVGHGHVPAAIALFAKDTTHAPREWAERFFNVQRYTELPRGGHFAAFEEPALLAEDLRAFLRPLRPFRPLRPLRSSSE